MKHFWYIPLNAALKKPIQETELKFLENEFFLDPGAIVCFLITHIWNSIKTYLWPSKYDLRQEVDTKLRPANCQLIPTEGNIRLKFLPFRDYHATLTITFEKPDFIYKILAIPSLQI